MREMPPKIEFTYNTVKIGNYNLTYWDEGPKNALIICFLHGYTGCIDGWYFQIAEFSKKYRCLAQNHRCHGNSECRDEPVTIKDLSEDFNECLDKLNINKQVIVIGKSMGGFIAQQFALDHQDRIKALILTDTSPFLSIPKDSFEQVQKMGVAELARVMDKVFSIPLRKRPRKLREYYKNLSDWEYEQKKHLPVFVATNFLNAINQWNVEDRLFEIKVPTLIIFGEKDTMIEKNQYSNILKEKIPNSDLIIIKDAGHGPQIEQVDEYNKVVANYIEKVA